MIELATSPILVTALKSLVLGGLAFIVSLLLIRSSASAKRALWTATVLSLVLLPVLSRVVPGWTLELPPGQVPTVLESAMPATNVDSSSVMPADAPSSPAVVQSPFEIPWGALLLGLWGVGTGLLLLRMIVGMVRARKIMGAATTTNQFNAISTEITEYMEIRGAVQIRLGQPDSAPFTTGLWRPVIVLPQQASTWPETQVRATLVHELTHVRHRDWLLNLLVEFTKALYWPNPFAWLAATRFRMAAEQAADDAVLDFGIRPTDYAEHLVSVARSMNGRVGLAMPMARKKDMGIRLQSILDHRPRRTRRLTLTLAASVVPLAALPIAAVGKAAIDSNVAQEVRGWTQTTKSGVKVELVGISMKRGDKVRTWTPDGRVLPGPLEPWNGGEDQEMVNRQFTFKMADDLRPRYLFTSDRIKNETEAFSLSKPGGWSALTGQFSKEDTRANIKVGVVSGRWVEAMKLEPKGQNSKISSATFDSNGNASRTYSLMVSVVETQDKFVVQVTDNSVDREFRVLGMYGTPSDRLIKSATPTGGAMKLSWPALIQMGYTLDKTVDLREIIIETRPYEWLEFKNIPLAPPN